ncbi:MAG: SRPBCC family protein [Pseudomonadota bacterium]
MSDMIAEVTRAVEIAAPAERVWAAITGETAILDWHPAVASCTAGVDDAGRLTRHMVLHPAPDVPPGTPPIAMFETELLRSAAIFTISYVVEIEGLAIRDYHAQMSVTPEEAGCLTRLRSRFVMPVSATPDPRVQVAEFYEMGLARLARQLSAG